MVDLIDGNNADDCAVVLDASSPITDSVRSALYSKGIPFHNRLGVRDLAQIRDYLQFVTLSLSYDILHVRDVRELYSNYNGFFLPGLDWYLLSKLESADSRERGAELIDLMRDARSMTFGEMRERLCDRRAKIQVGIVLEDLGLSDKRITGELVGELRYAVDNLPDLRHNEEVPLEEKSGVLIADCKNSVFVDRSLIFFLDMDMTWDISVAGMRYADSEAEAEKNAMRLTALLQQGERRVYMVNATKYGRRARPALTFDAILGRPADSFADISGSIVKGRWHSEREEVRQYLGEERLEDAETIIGAFSKSAFNSYFSCPRMYFFSRIISSSETDAADFGNLVHEFAQLYICYPEIVREEGFDKLVDIVSGRYSGLSTPLMEKIDRDRIACAMRNVARYIDSRNIGTAPLDRPADEDHPNRFFQRYGLDRWSSVSEVGAVSRDHPMYGKFDAVASGVVMDFKTGKAKTGDDIRKGMSADNPSRYPEFQPIMYSVLAAESIGKKDLELFYAMENDWESMGEGYDINRNVRTVRLMEERLEEIIRGDVLLRRQMEEKLAKEFRENADEVLAAVAENSSGLKPSEWDSNPSMVSAVLEAAGLKRTDTNAGKAAAALRKIAKAVSEGMLSNDDTVEISLDARNEFIDMLEQMHKEAMEYACSSFPARPKVRCEDCRYLSVCTADKTDAGEETVG
ncbi:MAG: PD-(D/E)XK nuclease family protein [Candidatus Methanomethylophilaceae archaeon]|nr:PD-(D/E)XK nuclease family protein [Candidatus Methanomethylophilaceae archaeon]